MADSRKLTPKQQAFCEHYIASLNASDAARKAGYRKPAVQGYENLRKPHIQNYIEKVLKTHSTRRIASAEEVLEYLTSVARGEETEQALTVVGGNAVLIDREVATRDRLKAAELLGRRHTLFTDKAIVEAKVDPTGLLDEIAAQIG